MSPESIKLFKQGEIFLKSLEQHWLAQAHPSELPENLHTKVRDHYYVELTTNDRLHGPQDSICVVVQDIKARFDVIAAATPDLIDGRAETVAYVPQEVLSEHRSSQYGIFVEPDKSARERSVRLVVHVSGHSEPSLRVKIDGIRRLLGQSAV